MEEFWDNNGPYALAKLADRLVPIPRDNEAQVSLYALCRAWVRNNPALPLVAESPSPQQPYPTDAAARIGGDAGTNLNGDPPQAGAAQEPQPAAPQQPQEQQPQQEQLDAQAPPPPPHDPQPNGLLSILPPVLPPTALETNTVPPTYPLDDFEVGELEDALRKFKEHWTAVRQYHQALRAAKMSRHRERLLVLLGEPSLLQPPMHQMQLAMQQMQMGGPPLGMMVAPHPHAAALLQMQQMQMLGPDQMAANGGMPGLMFQGAGPGQGLPPGVAGFAMPQQAGMGGGAAVSAAEAQAALATIMNLGPAGADPSAQPQQLGGEELLPTAAQLMQLGQQQQQQLFLQLQQQQQLGLLASGAGAGAAGQMAMLPSLEMLQALQQQQQQQQLSQQAIPPQSAAAAAAHLPVLGQLAAAMAAAAETAQGEQQGCGYGRQQGADSAATAGNGAASAPEAQEQAAPLRRPSEKEAPVPAAGPDDGMDVDSGPPPGS